MAQVITGASYTEFRDGTGVGNLPAQYVICTVKMPIAEYTTFIATGTLTNSVPAATTTEIAARLAAGG